MRYLKIRLIKQDINLCTESYTTFWEKLIRMERYMYHVHGLTNAIYLRYQFSLSSSIDLTQLQSNF